MCERLFYCSKVFSYMYISKTKTYSYSLAEMKSDLMIHYSDETRNGEVDRFYKSAVSSIEKIIASDIVPTVNQLEDYDYSGSIYQINEPNIVISAITVTNNISTTPTSYSITSTGYTIQKYNQYTLIKFKNSFVADVINITYSSGYGASAIPLDLKRAIVMMTAQLMDVDRQGYVSNGVVQTKAIDRLISPYINLIY